LFHHWFILAVLAVASIFTGCTTRRIITPDRNSSREYLFVVRAEENVTLSWESRADRIYTITYNTDIESKTPWKVLPGVDPVRGTGGTMTFRDRVPVNESRVYDLHTYSGINPVR